MRLCTLVLILALAAVAVSAQPTSFTYQGRLLNSSGVPITSGTVVRFTIWRGGDANTANTGTLVYQETVTVTPDATGIFSHTLGAVVPDSGNLSAPTFQTTSPLYLQVNVPFDGAALLPRTQLLSVPYAQVSTQLTRTSEALPIPVLGARTLFGSVSAISDDNSDIAGITMPPTSHRIAADATLPVTWNTQAPTLEITAELYNQPLNPNPALRTAFFSFRLHDLETGGVFFFEGAHTFTGTDAETFTIPLVLTGGTFTAGDAASWTFERKADNAADTLPGDVLLLNARALTNVAR